MEIDHEIEELYRALKTKGIEPSLELIARYNFKFFFTKVLGLKWAPHHDEWLVLLQNHKRILIECARGHGKTVFMVAYTLWLVYQGNPVDILLISYSEDQIKNNVMNVIDKIIMNNDYLAHLRPSTKQQWGAQLKTFSNGSQIRGESFGSSVRGAHPDYLFVDDPLKDKGGMTPQEQLDYYMTALMGTVKETTQVVVTGTPLDNGDLLEQLEGNKAYTFKAYPAENEERTSPLFPYLYSLEFLRATEEERGSFAYSREYLLKRIDPKTQVFADRFRVINLDILFPEFKVVRTKVDPAISEKDAACDSAIVTSGIDSKHHLWEVSTKLLKSDNPKKILDAIIREIKNNKDLCSDYAVVIESEVFQKVLAYDLKQAMLEQDLNVRVIEIAHSGNQGKHERIMGLQNKWEAYAIHLLPESPLIGQCRYYRPGAKGLRIDGLDALSMVRLEDVAVPMGEAVVVDPGCDEAWESL